MERKKRKFCADFEEYEFYLEKEGLFKALYNLILADIVQCFLLENVAKVIFISKNEEGAKLTKKLSMIIGAIFEKKCYFKREIPEVFVYTISYEEVKSKKIKKIMLKYAKKDNWINNQK